MKIEIVASLKKKKNNKYMLQRNDVKKLIISTQSLLDNAYPTIPNWVRYPKEMYLFSIILTKDTCSVVPRSA